MKDGIYTDYTKPVLSMTQTEQMNPHECYDPLLMSLVTGQLAARSLPCRPVELSWGLNLQGAIYKFGCASTFTQLAHVSIYFSSVGMLV